MLNFVVLKCGIKVDSIKVNSNTKIMIVALWQDMYKIVFIGMGSLTQIMIILNMMLKTVQAITFQQIMNIIFNQYAQVIVYIYLVNYYYNSTAFNGQC